MQPSRTSGAPAAATYRGTGGTLLRTAGWTVLLDVEPGHPLVDLCWARLTAIDPTADPDDVLDTLLAQGLRAVPAFALLRETGESRVVAHGVGTVTLDGADALLERSGGAWVDLPLTDVSVVEVTLTDTPTTGPSLPLRDGAAAATGFSLVLRPGPDGVRPDGLGDPLAAERLRVTRPVPGAGEATRPVAFTRGVATTAGPRGTDRVRPGVTRPPVRDEVGAPRVLAAVCPAGHLTPAYTAVCRVCRRTVPAQEAFETARPALGRLVLPGGGSLLLDRGAVLGREPHVPVSWVGTRPHLVALPDPDHDVSAQHAAVVLDLWDVSVCDLGSTNGTALVDEAGRVTALRPYEPVVLGPGSTVVLAEVVTLAYAVHQ